MLGITENMSQLAIKVEIAGRTYPLNVKPEEEENVRKAAKMINDSYEKLKGAYTMTDTRDLLCMASLEVCTRALNSAGMADRAEIEAEIATIEMLIGHESNG